MKQDYICVSSTGPGVGLVFVNKQPLTKRKSEWTATDGTSHWIYPHYFPYETLIPYVVKRSYNIGDRVSIRPCSHYYTQTYDNPRCDVVGEITHINPTSANPYLVTWDTRGVQNSYDAEDLFLRAEFKPKEIDLTSLYRKEGTRVLIGENHSIERRTDSKGAPFIKIIDAGPDAIHVPLGKIPNLAAALLEFI